MTYPYQPQTSGQYYFVNSIEEAKSFYMTPNQSIMLMDSHLPVCYLKQTNLQGQSTLKSFKLVEISENEIAKMNEPKPSEVYASKEDINNLNSRLDELVKSLTPKEK